MISDLSPRCVYTSKQRFCVLTSAVCGTDGDRSNDSRGNGGRSELTPARSEAGAMCAHNQSSISCDICRSSLLVGMPLCSTVSNAAQCVLRRVVRILGMRPEDLQIELLAVMADDAAHNAESDDLLLAIVINRI